jgi:hypothetical protein
MKKDCIRTTISGQRGWQGLAVCACICLGLSFVRGQAPLETWTDANGRSLQARFVSLNDQTVTLSRADGRIIKLPLFRLNDASVAKAQAQASPAPDALAQHEPAAEAPAVHGVSGSEIASLKVADTILTIEKDGDAFLTCTGGETFPLELSAKVYVTKNGEKERVNGRADAAPKVHGNAVILSLAFGADMNMELHYELDPKGACTIWYRFKNTGKSEAEPQARIRFPQVAGTMVGQETYFKNRTNEPLTASELRSWLGRKTLKMSGFKGYGSDKMSYNEPAEKDTSGSFKSLAVDDGVYHSKPVKIEAPKSRDIRTDIFLQVGQAPMNGFSIRLVNTESWERSDHSSGMTVSF